MLTAVQHKTYQFIKNYITKNGYAPTTAEIAKGIQIKSRGVVYRYLQALAEKGLIQLLPQRRRNIELMEASNPFLPLIGKIAAGSPIEAVSHQETINMMDIFAGPNRFALQVKGDSMIDEGIWDGDMVVCERSNHAADGQIVVALIDNEYATLKKLRRHAGKITLLPANAKHEPQTYAPERVNIQGIFVGLLRYEKR